MKVKFVPQNIEVEATPDKSLLQIATENHLEIKSICKGVPSCAECRVRIIEGEQNVVPPGKPELSLIGTSYYIDSRRLSCQVHCFGDVVVDLTEQIERAENQTKKVRGFRTPTSKHMESRAIQDTMILNEKIETPERTSGGTRAGAGADAASTTPAEGGAAREARTGQGRQNQNGGNNKSGEKQSGGRNRNRRRRR